MSTDAWDDVVAIHLSGTTAQVRLLADHVAGDPDALRKMIPAHLGCERDFPRGVKQLVAERFGTSDVVRMG